MHTTTQAQPTQAPAPRTHAVVLLLTTRRTAQGCHRTMVALPDADLAIWSARHAEPSGNTTVEVINYDGDVLYSRTRAVL